MELDLDTMGVMQTAPTHIWGNHVERVMSILHLGLQEVALARDELLEEKYAKNFKKCNGMSVVRKVAEAYNKKVVDVEGLMCPRMSDGIMKRRYC